MRMQAGKKYSAITDWLSSRASMREEMSFGEIEKLIGARLPDSARLYRPWWGNEVGKHSRQCQAWQAAGWRVDEIDFVREQVVFVR
ncbi:MAG: hypothetical protein WAM91_01935 [Candidatus Acidiferrales bacterium]